MQPQQPQQPFQKQIFVQNQYTYYHLLVRVTQRPLLVPTTSNPNTFINNNPNFYVPVPSPQEPILKGKYFRDGKIAQWSGFV